MLMSLMVVTGMVVVMRMAFMLVALMRMLKRGLSRFRIGGVFEGVCRAQRFAFRARNPRQISADLVYCVGRIAAATWVRFAVGLG